MQVIKRPYSTVLQALGGVGPFSGLLRDAPARQPYGWARWAASLFAIHNPQRMVALDCPWWNVRATRDVEAFLRARPAARVFEYGAGASTIWLARRAGTVVSVEHDADWYERCRDLARPCGNAQILWRDRSADPSAYVDAIDAVPGLFDLIVIDGRDRGVCLAQAKRRLTLGGIILFDDTGRARYRDAIASSGLIERRYFGRSYCVPYPDHTSILSR
ncbi:class I SAM-dependent methyltransferase [Hephaestia mangrovi]|uniref:class I SAM-dependent methyltransferase n=1 Tax=Hephaestia mangrovi TaxID=2873268 RepID=UPI001CA75175|nr:class I SAM-dependent methyltransferase [Hephaestia mangrovi]MBY8828725.1 class I SAM-dependent methyltransferase [Hephaestia mangrovi]